MNKVKTPKTDNLVREIVDQIIAGQYVTKPNGDIMVMSRDGSRFHIVEAEPKE